MADVCQRRIATENHTFFNFIHFAPNLPIFILYIGHFDQPQSSHTPPAEPYASLFSEIHEFYTNIPPSSLIFLQNIHHIFKSTPNLHRNPALQNSKTDLSISLHLLAFSLQSPSLLCKLPPPFFRYEYPFPYSYIYSFTSTKRPSRFGRAAQQYFRNPCCCFPDCSRLQSRSSGRLLLRRSCTAQWWAPG